MCGIAGVLDCGGRRVDESALHRMTDAMAHRGPDGEGVFSDGPVGLGHRRLAIIDLTAAAAQPMSSADGRHVIVYNGEVYNFRELRGELEGLERSFHSRSDTEVVLQAYQQWGPACVEKLNGMFAFAIWDKTAGELFLARDRYGIKPLYYTFQGDRFIFASEQKAMLAGGDVARRVDLEAMLEYFTFQNFFTDRTLLKGVRMFPAGCWAKLAAAEPSQELRFVRYWDFHFREPQKAADEAEYLEELNRLFRQAVVRQLVSDVEVGAYLSGGMDSGSITAVAATHLPYIRTFTCGFDLHSVSGLELAYDEREKAEYMSYLFKTEHYEMVLKAGDMERVLPAVTWHLEEPRVGQSYPNFYISQLASKFVKVVLSGTGGDELFGGYPWRYYRAAFNDDFEDYIDKYYLYWQRLIDNRYIRKAFQPVWDEVKGVWTRDIFRDVFGQHANSLKRPEDYINHSLYFEAKTFLHGLLTVEDKLAMAHSLEVRVPFLDNDLVDFAMQVPVSMKLGNLGEVTRVSENEPGKERKYFQQTHDGKVLLRKMMSRYIPPEVTNGAKQGFSAPDATWFRGESIDYVRCRLYRPNARIFEFLDRQAVLELVDEHLEGRQNRRLLIWSLLNVEHWLEQFLGD